MRKEVGDTLATRPTRPTRPHGPSAKKKVLGSLDLGPLALDFPLDVGRPVERLKSLIGRVRPSPKLKVQHEGVGRQGEILGDMVAVSLSLVCLSLVCLSLVSLSLVCLSLVSLSLVSLSLGDVSDSRLSKGGEALGACDV